MIWRVLFFVGYLTIVVGFLWNGWALLAAIVQFVGASILLVWR